MSSMLERTLASARRVVPRSVKVAVRDRARRLLDADGPPAAHFLHIGKTGGTAIKHALTDIGSTPFGPVRLHTHDFALWDVPPGHRAFFVVRDPVARFCSAFWSRQRKGRPRYDKEWTPGEQAAFERFATPDDLGSALSSPDPAVRAAAWSAMSEIGHVRTRLSDWLGSPEYLCSRADDILWIGRQETLEEDVRDLSRLLGVSPAIELPGDDVLAHRNQAGYDDHLTDQARVNVELWYGSDLRLIEACADVSRR